MEGWKCEESQCFAHQIEAGNYYTISSLFFCYGVRTAPSSRLDLADIFLGHSTSLFYSLV